MKKWKFINNGTGWWLQITDINQLILYLEKTNHRFGDAMMNVVHACNNNKCQHYTNQLDSYLELLYRNSGKSLIETANNLMFKYAETCYSLLKEKGFININKLGGCNNDLYTNAVIVYKEKCIFPDYTEKNIKIKTWELEDKKMGNFRSNYKYHYYAYIDNIQIKDGNKEKWDTYQEAYDFAKQYISKGE